MILYLYFQQQNNFYVLYYAYQNILHCNIRKKIKQKKLSFTMQHFDVKNRQSMHCE